MISGSIVALVTPMHADGAIDWQRLDELVEWHIASGTNGLVPVGTTGESATLDIKEHCDLVKRVVERVRGRIPVIAGTGANATKEAIELTQAAKDAGADACLLVTPYYNKPTQEGLFRHYQAIAEAVDLPQILYNVPGRTACDLLPETVARLAEIDEVIGIKEATGNIDRTLQILELCRTPIKVFSGDDETAVELMIAGASGTISVTANVAPAEMARICRLLHEGRIDEARELDQRLLGLHQNLFLESNPIPVKWALLEMGRINQGIRLPLTELSPQYHHAVRDALRQAGVLN